MSSHRSGPASDREVGPDVFTPDAYSSGADGVRPARPHHKLTADGRRMREVLSYSRRGSRFTPTQQQAWDRYADRWVIAEEELDRGEPAIADWFGRDAPLIVEIGSGVGEATGLLAAARPECNVLALEVWRPGIAAGLAEVAGAGATNVRFCAVDAAWVLRSVVASEELAELWTFFPDPWPKTKHHKRRLIQPEFALLVADRLAPGAVWRLATDWPDYADQMAQVLSGVAEITGGPVPRWEQRPVTKFERKGLAQGRRIVDLCYHRKA